MKKSKNKYFFYVITLLTFVQILLDGSLINIACALMVFSSTALTFYYIMYRGVFQKYPLPCWAIISFNFSTQSGALIFQSLFFTSLITLLEEPLATFFYLAVFNSLLVLSLYIFVSSPKLNSYSTIIRNKIIFRLDVFKYPSVRQLWIMGILAILAFFYKSLSGNTIEYGDVGGKFIEGFIPFLSAPYLLLVSRFYKISLINKQLLYLYTFIIIVMGAASNSRTTIFIGLANAGLFYIFLLLSGRIKPPNITLVRAISLASIIFVLAPAMTNLATAMLVARLDRQTSTLSETITNTVDALLDTNKLKEYRDFITSSILTDYSEKYIDNEVLSRFITTKFTDITLSTESIYLPVNQEITRSFILNKIISVLPSPLLPNSFDKNEVLFISFGDTVFLADSGRIIAGMKTGSNVGSLVSMGLVSFLFLIPFFVIFIIIFHSLEFVDNNSGFIVATPFCFLIYPIYLMFCGDSIAEPVMYIIRVVPQTLVVYFLVFIISRKL